MPKNSPKTASLLHENQFLKIGCQHIVGMDEAGRGTWAGPIAVGAVCLPIMRPDLAKTLAGVRDSKEMTARRRTALVETIKTTALAWGVGSASSEEIDEHGINPATFLAMNRAYDTLLAQATFDKPDCLFLDSILWLAMRHIPQVSMIDGDKRSLSIAAASVLAKTWRDEHMVELAKAYPQYEFAAHKGYGTAKHRAALESYGVSPVHRKSYAPIRKLLSGDA